MFFSMRRHGMMVFRKTDDSAHDALRAVDEQAEQCIKIVEKSFDAAKKIETSKELEAKAKPAHITRTFDHAKEEIRKLSDTRAHDLDAELARAEKAKSPINGVTATYARSVLDYNGRRAEQVLSVAAAHSRMRAVQGY